jgi:outer membrane lipoprotein carrier protein
MNLLRVVSALLLVGVSALPALALQIPKYNVSLNEVIATIEKPFSTDRNGSPEIHSVQADFFQRSTIAAKKKEFRADGQMYLKPATSSESLKFRFDYFRPTRQEIVCDGSTLWIYLPENRQVILSDVAEFFDPSRSRSMKGINFLQGLGRISKDFTIIFNNPMTDQVGNFILELTPRRSSATIEKLFITVSRAAMEKRAGTTPKSALPPATVEPLLPFPILATTVIDHEGNSTTMEFSNAVTNRMVSDMLFRFDVPANVQVVRPGGTKWKE